ncbi:hypothetical protein AALA48_06370 [Bifidobacterium pseudolongum]|uniref:hypothetical protein n=1 Tax=Bifidobacterium pseudolongum TaxID=1694 RepID=UPI0035162BAB
MSNDSRFEVPLYPGYSYRIVQEGYNADPQWVFVVPERRDVAYYRHVKERVDALLDELIAVGERLERERKRERVAECRQELERIDGGALTEAASAGDGVSDGV